MLTKILQQPTVASKEWVYDQFDTNAQAHTVVGPGSDAAVVQLEDTDVAIAMTTDCNDRYSHLDPDLGGKIAVAEGARNRVGSGADVVQIEETDVVMAMTTDCNSRYIYLDPESGGKIAVAEAARNLVASGAKPLALTDGLNYGNPEDPEVFWQMERSITGISTASEALKTPVVSGNVSLYNQSKEQAIFPTPIIGMVGLFASMDDITPSHFQQSGDMIYVI